MGDDMFDFEKDYADSVKIRVSLICVCHLGENDYGVFLVEQERGLGLPTKHLSSYNTTEESAFVLLQQMFGLKDIKSSSWPNWTTVNLLDVKDEINRQTQKGLREIVMVYGCFVPKQVKPESHVKMERLEDVYKDKRLVEEEKEILFRNIGKLSN